MHQERVARAILGPAHHVGARLEMRIWFRDQLQLDDEENSEIADGGGRVCGLVQTGVRTPGWAPS